MAMSDGGLADPFGLPVLTLSALFEGKPRGYGELRRQLERTWNQEVDLTPVLDDLTSRGLATHAPETGYTRTERGSDVIQRVRRVSAAYDGLRLTADGDAMEWRKDDSGWRRTTIQGTPQPDDPTVDDAVRGGER
jgi:DNA-binding PadR family transcriptional regulator